MQDQSIWGGGSRGTREGVGGGRGERICSLRLRSGWEELSAPPDTDRSIDGEISFLELISLQSDGGLLIMEINWQIVQID